MAAPLAGNESRHNERNRTDENQGKEELRHDTRSSSVTAANQTGLWAVNTHGVLIGLLRTGDSIAAIAGQTRKIKSFLALPPAPGSIGAANGYDNAGHVAALVTFTDGKIALVEFTIP